MLVVVPGFRFVGGPIGLLLVGLDGRLPVDLGGRRAAGCCRCRPDSTGGVGVADEGPKVGLQEVLRIGSRPIGDLLVVDRLVPSRGL